jgi:endonuclease/exonuclease/phosphatase family metal-dependent hydrolase
VSFLLILIFTVLLTLLFGALLYWASGGRQSPGWNRGEIHTLKNLDKEVFQKSSLRVLSWNIAYAQGRGSAGDHEYIPASEELMRERLQKMGELIQKQKADIVLLQEVDFASGRSHHLNQLKLIQEASGLSFAASALTWKAGYIPYPYWPIQHHFKKIRSGGAILSRYPITHTHAFRYPKPKHLSFLYRAFYLFRYSQWASIQLGEKSISVINNHLEAFDLTSREQQALSLKDLIRERNDKPPLLLFGGDLNTTPPSAQRKKNFPDALEDNYENDSTLEIFESLSEFREMIPREKYTENEEKYFTFPAWAPSRRLDYLFIHKNREIDEALVLHEAGDLSDHLPIFAQISH